MVGTKAPYVGKRSATRTSPSRVGSVDPTSHLFFTVQTRTNASRKGSCSICGIGGAGGGDGGGRRIGGGIGRKGE